jgi:DnaJ family protein C protein 28
MTQRKTNSSRLLFYRSPPTGLDRREERLRAARDKVAEYQTEETLPPVDEHDPDTLEEWADLVSKRIEEAMRRGDFDNLPGRGKPLRLQHDPFVPEEQQMAFKLLQNNDLTPNWIAERKEILRVNEQFGRQVQAIAQEALAQWAAAPDDAQREQVQNTWARWIARWEAEIVAINRRIQTLNLKQPVNHLEIIKLRLDDELRRAGVGRVLTV